MMVRNNEPSRHFGPSPVYPSIVEGTSGASGRELKAQKGNKAEK